MNLDRVRRLLKLIHLLQAGRASSVQALASEAAVSRRTVFRDLQLLKSAGVPMAFDEPSGKYRLTEQWLLPPATFSAEEALALVLLGREMGADSGLPYCQAARRATLKLQSCLPPAVAEHLRELSGRVEIRLAPKSNSNTSQPTFDCLLAAANTRTAVRITYDSVAERQVVCTKLLPYHVLFSQRSWYVIGRSSLHRGTRTFHMGRIRKIEALDERFDLPRGFSLKRYFRNAWHMIPESGPDQHVELRFSPLVARNVAEVSWHATQQCRFLADGSLDFCVQVSGLWEISWWIQGYGDQVQVTAPLALREMIATRLRSALALYAPPNNAPPPPTNEPPPPTNEPPPPKMLAALARGKKPLHRKQGAP